MTNSSFFRDNKRNPLRIKIEFNDHDGAKYSFAVEGLSKENMIKLIDFVQSVSPKETGNGPLRKNTFEQGKNADTNFARVYLLLETKFRFGSFTSADVRNACQDELGLQLTLPTVSTYLSRLAERDLLTRNRNGAGWIYRLTMPQQELETDLPLIKDQKDDGTSHLTGSGTGSGA